MEKAKLIFYTNQMIFENKETRKNFRQTNHFFEFLQDDHAKYIDIVKHEQDDVEFLVTEKKFNLF